MAKTKHKKTIWEGAGLLASSFLPTIGRVAIPISNIGVKLSSFKKRIALRPKMKYRVIFIHPSPERGFHIELKATSVFEALSKAAHKAIPFSVENQDSQSDAWDGEELRFQVWRLDPKDDVETKMISET